MTFPINAHGRLFGLKVIMGQKCENPITAHGRYFEKTRYLPGNNLPVATITCGTRHTLQPYIDRGENNHIIFHFGGPLPLELRNPVPSPIPMRLIFTCSHSSKADLLAVDPIHSRIQKRSKNRDWKSVEWRTIDHWSCSCVLLLDTRHRRVHHVAYTQPQHKVIK